MVEESVEGLSGIAGGAEPVADEVGSVVEVFDNAGAVTWGLSTMLWFGL